MSVTEYLPRADYIGNGSVKDYSFDFKITEKRQLRIIVTDAAYAPQFIIRGDDAFFLTGVDFDPINGKGQIHLTSNLANNYHLTILLDENAPIQPWRWRNKGDFYIRDFESGLDNAYAAIQTLTRKVARALRISENLTDVSTFNPELPINSVDPLVEDNADKLLAIGVDNASLKLGPTIGEFYDGLAAAVAAAAAAEAAAEAAAAAAEQASSGTLPLGGGKWALIEKQSATDNDVAYTVPLVVQGISARFGNVAVDLSGIKAIVDYIFQITYTPPTIVLSSPQNILREKGTVVSSVTLNATLTKYSNDIYSVAFFQNLTQIGSTQTSGGGIPSGGVSTQNYSTPFSDNLSFTAKVQDIASGIPISTITSNTMTIPFVYPYYYGAGAAGLGASVTTLTKDVANNTSNYSKTLVSTGGQKFYVAYPVSYGALTSILDANLFETISTWTRTTVNITGLDGNAVSYYVYETNNLVIAGSFAYQFKK